MTVPCPACRRRRAQLAAASAAGVSARRAEAAVVLDTLVELLRPMLARDPHLSARAAARRLVGWGAIEFELEDRARRVGGRLRRDLAGTVDHHQRGADTVLVAEGIEVAK
jgi:hypothetical protein